MSDVVRERAALIVDILADRLADIDRVMADSLAPGNLMPRRSGPPVAPWSPLSLSDGLPALALLFAELGSHDSRHLLTAHELISAAASLVEMPVRTAALFSGPSSLAWAAHAAHLAAMSAAGAASYQTLLGSLDAEIEAALLTAVREDASRIADGGCIGSVSKYDVIGGVAGTGRYLLCRALCGITEARAALAETLGLLVAVTEAEDLIVDGTPVPAWWVRQGWTTMAMETEHVNLGLAHGISGPLALLAVAWRSGIRIQGQDQAIARLVALLDKWRFTDDLGPGWPHAADLSAHRGQAPAAKRIRDAWCYGSVGVARALHLAGTALDRPRWTATARHAMCAALTTDDAIADNSLCHGRAGLLQVARRMRDETGDPFLEEAIEQSAARIVGDFEPGAPFGFTYNTGPGSRADRAGFLEGAAGIALALHGYAVNRLPRTSWDTALLLG